MASQGLSEAVLTLATGFTANVPTCWLKVVRDSHLFFFAWCVFQHVKTDLNACTKACLNACYNERKCDAKHIEKEQQHVPTRIPIDFVEKRIRGKDSCQLFLIYYILIYKGGCCLIIFVYVDSCCVIIVGYICYYICIICYDKYTVYIYYTCKKKKDQQSQN